MSGAPDAPGVRLDNADHTARSRRVARGPRRGSRAGVPIAVLTFPLRGASVCSASRRPPASLAHRVTSIEENKRLPNASVIVILASHPPLRGAHALAYIRTMASAIATKA